MPDPLEEYQKKRRFGETPEPEGRASPPDDQLRFVVQKHRASRLHYDFRLEWGGVLKSWAVPKGPSMNPREKRLAMMVEDHPLDYRTFEGGIPKGNYGAGTVMVWDEGAYSPRNPGENRAANEKIMQEGLERGRISFVLQGQKLKGEFSLVKMHGAEPNAWLLVKKNDDLATEGDVRDEDRSARSGRTMDEIAEGAAARCTWTFSRIVMGRRWWRRTARVPGPGRRFPRLCSGTRSGRSSTPKRSPSVPTAADYLGTVTL